MSEDTKEFILFLFMMAGAFTFGCLTGCETRKNYMEKDAVESGHAEYYLDANHNKQWRWKEAK